VDRGGRAASPRRPRASARPPADYPHPDLLGALEAGISSLPPGPGWPTATGSSSTSTGGGPYPHALALLDAAAPAHDRANVSSPSSRARVNGRCRP
jgi:hypothetical protein